MLTFEFTQLWASGYEIYDRLSPATAAYLEGLTAIHDGNLFHGVAERLGNPIRELARGSELNLGKNLQAIHPVIRTNRKFILLDLSWSP
jgi:alpha-ketoglutarate-dependent taurine dioxygenase